MVNGDGRFYAPISKSKTTKTGYTIRLYFSVGQHSRDVELLSTFIKFLNCGFVSLDKRRPVCSYSVTRFSDVLNIIIPFFEKYPLLGTKQLDFMGFCKVAFLMKDKAHLTNKGVE